MTDAVLPKNRKQRVYIVNKGAHDFSEAARYGDLVFCTEGVLGKYNTSQMTRVFQESFQDSDENDYILLTSLATLCSIACSVFAVAHGRLNLLIFKEDRYVVRRVVLKQQS